MSERITRADLDRIAAVISVSLAGSLKLDVSRRNGHVAVDLEDEHGTIDLLHIGTSREVYTYMQGMLRVLLISNRTEAT